MFKAERLLLMAQNLIGGLILRHHSHNDGRVCAYPQLAIVGRSSQFERLSGRTNEVHRIIGDVRASLRSCQVVDELSDEESKEEEEQASSTAHAHVQYPCTY